MFRRFKLAFLMLLSALQIVFAQTPTLIHSDPPPQSARQALLEMVFARTPGQLLSHLPKPAQKLAKANDNLLPLQALSQALMPLQVQEGKLETFETGPVLLRSENSYSHQTVEISVESETDGLNEDQLLLSLRLYRRGKPEALPFVPNATFTMKSEDGIWRLEDVSVNLRVPLGDENFLESLSPDRRPPDIEELERDAQNRLRAVNTAQVSYTAMFPELGFACSIAQLGGTSADEPTSAAAAGLIDPGLSSGTLGGYVFSIEGCSGSPVDHFSVSAVPESSQSGLRTFCSDESAVLRFSDDGDAGHCLSDGEPLP